MMHDDVYRAWHDAPTTVCLMCELDAMTRRRRVDVDPWLVMAAAWVVAVVIVLIKIVMLYVGA